jgi:hypothetical protein
MVDAPELGGVQALVAQSVLERFPEATLQGFARLDVGGRRSLGLEPSRELEGDELGSVVKYGAMVFYSWTVNIIGIRTCRTWNEP